MRTDGEGEGFDLIIECICADGIDAHHAVGQKHGGASWLKENADIADGGVDILHLRVCVGSEDRQGQGECGGGEPLAASGRCNAFCDFQTDLPLCPVMLDDCIPIRA